VERSSLKMGSQSRQNGVSKPINEGRGQLVALPGPHTTELLPSHPHYSVYTLAWSRVAALVPSFFFPLCTNLSFCFGGLITLFQLFHTPCKFASYHHTRETLKMVCLCTLLSPQLSLSLSLASQSFLAFVFYSISALRYLPRARISAPRRPLAFVVIRV
jgi:hypothetical protein